MIEIKTENHQCVCTGCNSQQIEQISYDKIGCNNILHAVLSVLTGVWLFVWIYKRKNSRNETNYNRRLALLSSKCNKCGGPLMLSSLPDKNSHPQI